MQNATVILTITEAMKILKLSRSSMYSIMGRGELKTIKFGKSRRIRLSDLEAFIARAAGDTEIAQSQKAA